MIWCNHLVTSDEVENVRALTINMFRKTLLCLVGSKKFCHFDEAVGKIFKLE